MNRFNPKKLFHSKWTALNPQNREKHFLVVAVNEDEVTGQLIDLELEAVMTKNSYTITAEVLKNSEQWQQGWK